MSGDGRYLRISRLRESSKDLYDEEEDVYDRASLEPQMALRFRNFDGPVSGMMDDCYATLSADGFTTPFLVVSRPTFGGSISGNFSQLMNATGYDHLVPEFQPYPNAPIARSGSDTIQTFQDSVGQHVVRVDRKTHTWLRAKTGPNSQPLAVQDDVFVRDKSQPYYRLSRVEANGDVTVVRAFPSRHVINATYDGTYVYWVELSGGGQILGPQSHFELWRTKYTRDIASFNASAEQIAALDGTFNYGFSLVFDGVFVTATAQETLVIRISDHKVKQLPSAATVEAVPFYVDQSDVWVRYIVAKPGDVHYAKVSIDW